MMIWIAMMLLVGAPQAAERFEDECGESNGTECPDPLAPLDDLDHWEDQLLPGEDD
jgi:hypothetical protein